MSRGNEIVPVDNSGISQNSEQVQEMLDNPSLQFFELHYPSLPNLFDAVLPLLNKINSSVDDPTIPEKEKWLFKEKDGMQPKISFMIFKDRAESTVCVVYDMRFSMLALSRGDIIVVRMGRVLEDIYSLYRLISPGDDNPASLPKEIVNGYLVPSKKEAGKFDIDSIFLNNSECSSEFILSRDLHGFPTGSYPDIRFLLDHFNPSYEGWGRLLKNISEKFQLSPQQVKQLRDKNLEGE